jgi:hypothetical protein
MNWPRLLPFLFFNLASLCAVEPLEYAPRPNDIYWWEEWHLENLNTNAARLGIDLPQLAVISVENSRGEKVGRIRAVP